MRIRLFAVFSLLALGACTSTPSGQSDSDAYVGCNGDPRINLLAFPANVATDDAALTLHFLAAEPSVPLAGDNTWTVAVQTASGGKADVSAIIGAAFMPDHGHPSSVAPIATHQPDGTWRIEHLNLAMAGVWRVTLTLKRAAGQNATAVVYVCVAG